MIWNKLNTIAILVFTIIATIATVRSCNIAVAVQGDERQLDSLHTLDSAQGQLNIRMERLVSKVDSELEQMKLQNDKTTILVKDNNSMATNLNKETSQVVSEIKIIKALQTRNRIINKKRLLSDIKSILTGIPLDSKNRIQQNAYLNQLDASFQNCMTNNIMAENDSVYTAFSNELKNIFIFKLYNVLPDSVWFGLRSGSTRRWPDDKQIVINERNIEFDNLMRGLIKFVSDITSRFDHYYKNDY